MKKSKSVIIAENEEGVCTFDKTKPTCLATDWSKTGIGYWLLQRLCQCPSNTTFCCCTGWKTALVGSCFTHAAKSRYSPVEREALAITDALDKARFFVLSWSDLTVVVYHKPLLKVLSDLALKAIPNPRLCNQKEKTLQPKREDPATKKRRPCTTDLRWYASLAFNTKQLMLYLATHCPNTPEMLTLLDHIATISDSPTPPPLHPYQCSFLEHFHREEPVPA